MWTAGRELLGMINYRLGNYGAARRELEAAQEQGAGIETLNMLADSYRAGRRWAKVDALWAEMAAASPSAELVHEGRLVYAGSLADRGRVNDAVRELARHFRYVRRPKPHHLATAYALGDLYERTGQLPRARDLFRWILTADPTYQDARERLAALG